MMQPVLRVTRAALALIAILAALPAAAADTRCGTSGNITRCINDDGTTTTCRIFGGITRCETR